MATSERPPETSAGATRTRAATPAAAAKGKGPKVRPAKMSEKALHEAIVGLYGGVGMLLAMPRIGLPETAEAVMESAETLADAWMELAKTNDTVWFMLQRVASGSAFGTIIVAHLPLFMAANAELAARRVVIFDPNTVTVDV